MCIGCHNIAGLPGELPRDLQGAEIAGQNAKYIVASLNAYNKGERKHPTMRAIATTLSDQDMADVAAYYEQLPVEGALPAGTTAFGSVNVPLSARVMSQVEERRGAECVITLEDAATGRVLARYEEALDVQPRDLWFWQGDPAPLRAAGAHASARRRAGRPAPGGPGAPGCRRRRARAGGARACASRAEGASSALLSRSLLASFVRPNHPEIAAVAREAAERTGQGDRRLVVLRLPDRAMSRRQRSAPTRPSPRSTRRSRPARSPTPSRRPAGTTATRASASATTATLRGGPRHLHGHHRSHRRGDRASRVCTQSWS